MRTATYSLDARVSKPAVEKILRRYSKRLTDLGYEAPEWATLPHGNRVTLFLTNVPAITSYVIAAVDGLKDDEGTYRTIIRAFPGKGDVDLTSFRDAAPRCDHCNTDRFRLQTFIVREPETDDLLMVGSTCVDAYSDREGTLAVWKAIADLNAALMTYEDFGSGDSDDEGWGSGGGGWHISVAEYTAAACCAIRHYGWCKSDGDQPTKFEAMGIYRSPGKDGRPWTEERDTAEADAAILWAKDYQGDNEYRYSLSTVAGLVATDTRFMGILASLPYAYQRHLAREAERAAEKLARLEEPLAADKVRVRDIPVTIMDTRVIDGAFGSSLLIKMRDEAGHTLTWFSSSWPEVSVGRKATLTGTVKRYNEDRGETQLSRCVLTVEEEAA